MAWRDKLWNWSRRVQPVSNDTESQSSTSKLSDSISLPENKAGKSDDAAFVTTATFGHILHSETDVSFAKLARHRRILCPIIPHPAAFSSLKPDDAEPLAQETAIILNFAPRIDRESGLGKGPGIQLRLPVSSDSDLSNFSLPQDATFNAILPRYTKDVLLPAQSVDVRFAHHRSVPLDIHQSSLQDFLAISEFNLLAGKLRTPSQVTFSIPEKMLSGRSPVNLKSPKNADVPYVFYGLEIHQTVEMHWRQHTLRYSSIEAGQHGGQRQELTIEAGRSDKPTAFKGEQRSSFLQCVEDLASGNVFSWDEGHKAMKERRFEDYSYDLPDEELGEDILMETEEDGFDEEDRPVRMRTHDEVDLEEGELMDEELDDVFDNDDRNGGLSRRESRLIEKEIDELFNLGSYRDADKDAGDVEKTAQEVVDDGYEASQKYIKELLDDSESSQPRVEDDSLSEDASTAMPEPTEPSPKPEDEKAATNKEEPTTTQEDVSSHTGSSEAEAKWEDATPAESLAQEYSTQEEEEATSEAIKSSEVDVSKSEDTTTSTTVDTTPESEESPDKPSAKDGKQEVEEEDKK